MSISGILLNHPEIIEDISVWQWMLPDEYELVNWNRSSIIQAEYSTQTSNLAYFGGHEGVVMTTDGGYSFKDLNINGYPSSAYAKKTKTIALYQDINSEILFAGNYDGLYQFDNESTRWSKLNLPGSETRVMKLIKYKDSLIVATDSEIFIGKVSNNDMKFKKLELARIDENPSMTLIELFFQLHSGEIWGLPGKLIFDVAALILLFLSVSGLYLWLSPKYRRFKENRHWKRASNHTGWFFKYHLKLGIWSFVILLIFAVTGLFMRPPLIGELIDGEIALKYVPASNPTNQWKHRIRNANYDAATDRVVIDTKDGYWVSDAGLYGKYSKQYSPVPIFAMGATVLENDDQGNMLVGSFAGLYRVTRSGQYAENVIDEDAPIVSAVRAGANLVTGYFKEPDGTEYVTTHFGGLINVENPYAKSKKFKMPNFLKENYSMSLWNYLFELHNGRIFQAFLGDFYILIIPLSALIFILVIVTGVFDWCYIKLKHR